MTTSSTKKLTHLYILALSAVAILTIAGQMLVQFNLKQQLNDASVINLAGRQRMLSQQICKNATLITFQIFPELYNQHLTELRNALRTWKDVHDGLHASHLNSIGSDIDNSPEIKQMFDRIQPHFDSIYYNANKIATANNQKVDLEKNLKAIIKNEKSFLKQMNAIVFQYNKEARIKVTTMMAVELVLMMCTLIILLVEGIYVYKPAVEKLSLTIDELLDSQQKTKLANDKLVKTNNDLLLAEIELIEASNFKNQELINQQRIRATSLLKGQESERKRIAREMHDGIGQMLTALKLNIESISHTMTPERNEQLLKEIKQLIAKTIVEARNITFDLMPTVLHDFGIGSALKQLAEQSSKNTASMVIYNQSNDIKRLDKNIEINLYRIAQEALNNAIKYAEATEIKISLSLLNKYIYLNISDNGKGFDLKKSTSENDAQQKINRGIFNMEERTHLLNGKLSIDSTIGKGTCIVSKIPLTQ